jgi:MGT family glycosyltransferase
MSKVLFLSVPAHGNINPTLGLVSELVKLGEEVIYFASEEFREKIEATGAIFKAYCTDLDIFKAKNVTDPNPIIRVVQSGPAVVADILDQIEGIHIDYMIHSAAFFFTKPIAQILKVPTISSLAIFAGLDAFFDGSKRLSNKSFSGGTELTEAIKQTGLKLYETYRVYFPDHILDIIFNKGDINLVYTSAYFAENVNYFDDTFKFVGPPVYHRTEDLDFPFDQLQGKKVLYISLGTIFGAYSTKLYDLFFEAFAAWDGLVVMAAYKVDLSACQIPANFIVKNYVPQNELLKYTTVAITHAGMNSMSDLISKYIPFVCIPLGADQPALARRAVELGATVSMDAATLDAATLRSAVAEVVNNPAYLENIKKIADSFEQAGGYPKAVEEIFKLKSKWLVKPVG